MTKQQKVYFDAIRRFIDRKGFSPSMQEVCELVSVTSTCTAWKMVHALLDQGYLRKDTNLGKYRNLVVVPEKLHGFEWCNRNHQEIWFQGTVCPLCLEIQRTTPPREVRVG